MIGMILSQAGGGGGGAGTVTSVATQSNSLADLTAPNPINGAGVIQFEVQIIDVTYVQAALLEAGGAFLPGVTYRIIDFNKTIGNGITLVVAEFKAVIADFASGDVILSTRGFAFSNGNKKYELSYDVATDFITELYLPELNQRASRKLTATTNEIETLPWEHTLSYGFDVVESDFLSLSVFNVNVVRDSVIREMTIDYIFTSAAILKSNLRNAILNFSDSGTMEGCTMKPSSHLNCGGPVTDCTWEEGAAMVVTNGSILTGMRFGTGSSYQVSTGIADTVNHSNDQAKRTIEEIVINDGDSVTISDSYSDTICIRLDLPAPILSCTINFPANAMHHQVIHIGINNAASGVLWAAGGGATIKDQVPVFSKYQCLSWIFDANTITWYLI